MDFLLTAKRDRKAALRWVTPVRPGSSRQNLLANLQKAYAKIAAMVNATLQILPNHHSRTATQSPT